MFNSIKTSLIFILIIFVIGVFGYHYIEGWSLVESVYMTVITLSTTGFQELKPLSTAGRIFTVFLIIFAVTFLFYAIGNMNIAIFENKIFRNRKMQKKIDQLKDHYIICGFGRMGEKISSELKQRKKQFVILEKREECVEFLEKHNDYLYIKGDATTDENLVLAGIEKARGLVAVLGKDVDNLFAVLSARQLNKDLKIIARAEEENSREKLIKAGANRVVLPYEIGGFRIAQVLIKPSVIDYFDELFTRKDLGLHIEELKISEKSGLAGKNLTDTNIRSEMNIIIIAIYRNDGGIIYNPRSDTELMINDTLIVIGESSELLKLEKLTKNEKN